jgi:hypothetical protein
MKQAVQLFQARHVDAQGQPPRPMARSAPSPGRPVRRDPGAGGRGCSTPSWARCWPRPGRRRRRGARAAAQQQPQARGGRLPAAGRGEARSGWCCAFTYWCFDEAAQHASRPNPMFQTAGCLAHWNNATRRGARRLLAREAVADPGLVRPGMVFIMDFGGAWATPALSSGSRAGTCTPSRATPMPPRAARAAASTACAARWAASARGSSTTRGVEPGARRPWLSPTARAAGPAGPAGRPAGRWAGRHRRGG